jgi:hypothetical protein
MTEDYLRAQAAPAATTPTDLYTAPAAAAVIVSALGVCNRAASATTFRVSVRALGAAQANEHYRFYDFPLAANDSIDILQGQVLQATDVVTVYAGSANVTFCLSLAECV